MTDVSHTLAERGARYGDFADHAKIAQAIKAAMYSAGCDKWGALPDMHKQALETIADKIARILNGDPNYADNWHDIQGYARLVEDRLTSATSMGATPVTGTTGVWIPWVEGMCVPREAVEVLLRSGERTVADAIHLRWAHIGTADDIVAYRPLSEP